jgi:hypothetical protein
MDAVLAAKERSIDVEEIGGFGVPKKGVAHKEM